VPFDTLSTSLEHIKAGRLRALAVTSAARSDLLPVQPQANSPRAENVDRLDQEVNAGLADPALKARIEGLGHSPFATTVTEFGSFIAEDTQKWGKVIRAANIKAN
jgi:tripartite-type tricarboxylate transporter receptor subunit TctC